MKDHSRLSEPEKRWTYKETTLSHHTFFTTKLIPKLDKNIDDKNMGKMREMTEELAAAVFSDGWTAADQHLGREDWIECSDKGDEGVAPPSYSQSYHTSKLLNHSCLVFPHRGKTFHLSEFQISMH